MENIDEQDIAGMTYSSAILHCTINIGLSWILANHYVVWLAKKYPESHLAAHIRFLDLT